MPQAWTLDDSLSCPQCRHHNALLAQPGIWENPDYLCRDCGFLYTPRASRCDGCGDPITKRCGPHCYERAPESAPELIARRREDFRDSGLYELCDATGTVVALLFRDPQDRQWYEETLPGAPQTHYSERWRGSTRSEAIASIVRRRAER